MARVSAPVSDSPTLRDATPGDAVAITELIESAYRGPVSRQGWTTEADLLDGQRTDLEAVREAISRDDVRLLVAIGADDRLLGCCQIERRSARLAYFGSFAVRPDLQNLGLGRVLLAAAESAAVTNWQSNAMEMTVIAQREELISWYERRGYEATGETPGIPVRRRAFGPSPARRSAVRGPEEGTRRLTQPAAALLGSSADTAAISCLSQKVEAPRATTERAKGVETPHAAFAITPSALRTGLVAVSAAVLLAACGRSGGPSTGSAPVVVVEHSQGQFVACRTGRHVRRSRPDLRARHAEAADRSRAFGHHDSRRHPRRSRLDRSRPGSSRSTSTSPRPSRSGATRPAGSTAARSSSTTTTPNSSTAASRSSRPARRSSCSSAAATPSTLST